MVGVMLQEVRSSVRNTPRNLHDALFLFHDRTIDGHWRMMVHAGPTGKSTIISFVFFSVEGKTVELPFLHSIIFHSNHIVSMTSIQMNDSLRQLIILNVEPQPKTI